MRLDRRFFVLTLFATVFFPTVSFASTSTPQCSITLTPHQVLVGQSVLLRWQSTSTATGTISHIGPVGPSGSFQLQPTSPARVTFEGVFHGPGGSVTCSDTVTAVASGSGSGGTSGTGGSSSGSGGWGGAGQTSSGGGTAGSGSTQGSGGSTQVGGGSTQGGSGSSGSSGAGDFMSAPQVPNTNMQTSAGNQQPTGNGFVPCGRSSAADYMNASGCQFVYIVSTVQMIINFLLGLSIPISVALFSWAGILYFTAQGDTGKIGKAHKIFTSVLVGFIITVSGWLVVQTVIASLTNQSFSWNSVVPVPDSARPRNVSISSLFSPLSMLPGGGLTTGSMGGSGTGPGGGTGPLSQCTNSNCSPSVLQEAGFTASQANVMSCIAMTENSGNGTGCKGNACGTFQIMITANPLVGSACSPSGSLNCPVLCRGSANGQNRPPSCDVCVQAAQNPACNAQAAAYLYSQSGYGPWTTQSDNLSAQGCINKYGGQ